VDELRGILDDLKAEIDRDRADLEAKAEGGSLPEGWRHPKQRTLDALHRLIERATSASN
jgi:hypothetical protein